MKRLKKGLMILVSIFLIDVLAGTTPVFCEMSNYELEQEVKKLKEQIKKTAGDEGGESLVKAITDRVTFSGVVEVEVGFEKGFDDEDSSDIALATVELGIEAEVTDWAVANVALLWEEDDTEPVDIDIGTITLGNTEKCPFYLSVGKMYVPFGNFESNMISDPLTLEIAETRESALQVGCERHSFYASLYVFNGDIDEDGDDDEIKCFGANAGYAFENNDMSLDIGVDWINNMVDSDGLGDWIEEEGLALREYAGGFCVHAIFNTGPFNMIGEYVGGTDDPEFSDGGPFEEVDALSAWNVEFGYAFNMIDKESTFAIAYQGTDECAGFLPEKRYMASVGMALGEYVGLALEYAHDEDYDINEGGTGDSADILTLQLAIEF